jgi:hypothetical protein
MFENKPIANLVLLFILVGTAVGSIALFSAVQDNRAIRSFPEFSVARRNLPQFG